MKFVACGFSHTVAVSKTGECYAWGNAHSGRLGIVPSTFSGHFDHVLVPHCVEALRGLVTVDSVACGASHTLFLTQDGRLFATGSNVSGQVRAGLLTGEGGYDFNCSMEVVEVALLII